MSSLSENLGVELVDILYSNTNLNYDVCAVSLIQILEHLTKKLPQLNDVSPQVISNIQEALESENINPDLIKLNTNLKTLFEINTDLSKGEKNFYECNSVIKKCLQQSSQLLKKASNRKVFKNTIVANRLPVIYLFEIWQLSTDKEIKNQIIELLNLCCFADSSLVSHFYEDINMTSEVCCQLKLDIVQCDQHSLAINLRFLTTLLTNSDLNLTKSLQEFLEGSDFLRFLLDTIESEHEFLLLNLEDFEIFKESQRITNKKVFTSIDLIIHFLFALNQKYVLPEENSIIKIINSTQESRKYLSEIIVNEINGEIDPLLEYKFSNSTIFSSGNSNEMFYYVNPALKLVSDMFSVQLNTTSIFYTNDFNVLIDITIRKLRNLSQNDQERVDYLSLFQLIAKNSNYKESYYRKNDLLEIFTSILKEPNETIDQDIVRIILFENNNFK